MRLTQVDIENFKCFKSITVALPATNGFYLLTGKNKKTPALGSNGLGKSSLFGAICWCLYGKTEKGKSAGSLRNRQTNKGYSVTLYFQKDGQDHKLVRTWNPISRQLDGNEVSDEEIAAFVGLTYEQFLLAVYFAQNGKSFIDLSPTEKLNFLSSLFELDKWIACSDQCKTKSQSINTELAKTEVELTTIDSHSRSLKASQESLITSSVDWGKTQAGKIEALEKQRDEILISLRELPPTLDLEKELEELKAYKEKLSKESANSSAEINKIDREIAVSESKFEAIASKIEDLTTKENTKCPQCSQIISPEHVRVASESLFEEAETLQIHLENLRLHITNCKQGSLVVEDLLKETESLFNNVRDQLSKYDGERRVEEGKRTQIQLIEKQLVEKRTETNPYEDQVKSLQQQIDSNHTKLEELRVKKKDLESKLAHYEFWQKMFLQLRLFILTEVVQELEVHFNQTLGTMGLADWSVTVSTEKELKSGKTKAEVHMTLLNDENEIDFDSLSGGECQRLRVCTDLGMSDLIKSRNGIPVDLLLLDEPCASLSQEGIEYLLSMLETLSSTQRVFLAEHRVLELNKFDGVYELIKEEDGNSVLRTSK